MYLPKREALRLAPDRITRVSVGEVRIVVEPTALDQKHFPAQLFNLGRSPVRRSILGNHLDYDSFKLAAIFRFTHGYVNIVVGQLLEVAVHRFARVGMWFALRQKRDQAHSR